jgi:agmatine deiminase
MTARRDSDGGGLQANPATVGGEETTPRSSSRPSPASTASASGISVPPEWAPHAATWIAWPHQESDWPGKLEPIPWVYAEIVRVLHQQERVEILCHNEDVADDARRKLDAHACDPARYRLHLVPNDRVWLRDSAPTFAVNGDGEPVLLNWRFNGWAKYDDYVYDEKIGAAVERITGYRRVSPPRPDGRGWRLVLEGGAIDWNGEGVVMVTEECLLSAVQARNPGLSKEDYEAAFREWLGASRTLWLGEGAVGDDTHGHIDDVARFVAPDTVVLAYEEDPADENHARSVDNARRLKAFEGGRLRVIRVPYPRPVVMDGQRLPASYANFYIANGVVLVPTFNDPNDRVALNAFTACFPNHTVLGIHAVDLVWGLGTLHCLTQQEPAVNSGAT